MNAEQFPIGQKFSIQHTTGYFEVFYKSETSTDFACIKFSNRNIETEDNIHFEFTKRGIKMWVCAAGIILYSKKTFTAKQITFHENNYQIQNGQSA